MGVVNRHCCQPGHGDTQNVREISLYTDTVWNMAAHQRASVVLRANDGEEIIVDRKSALQSRLVRDILDITEEASDDDQIIDIPVVDSDVLNLVKEWLKAHESDKDFTPQSEDDKSCEMCEFDHNFFNPMKTDHDKLYNVIIAANFMNIGLLLENACKHIAACLKDCKDADEMREYLQIDTGESTNALNTQDTGVAADV